MTDLDIPLPINFPEPTPTAAQQPKPWEYIRGPEGCANGDRDCDEYWHDDGTDRPEVEWCSHVEHRVATFADVEARQRLEWLLADIRDVVKVRTDETAVEVLDLVQSQVYALVCALGEIDLSMGGGKAAGVGDARIYVDVCARERVEMEALSRNGDHTKP